MIREYTNNLALQLGIRLSQISVVNGQDVGCLDVYLLHLSSKDKQASVLVYQSELDGLQNGDTGGQLELKVRAALSRLQMSLEP
jgi:hypothetical protein